jgi:hypothetical protein
MANPIPSSVYIDQGRDFSLVVTYKDPTGTPINLTGYSATFEISTDYNTSASLALTTSNGAITLGGSAGTITIHGSATQTSITAGNYVAELVVTSSGGIQTSLLKGPFVVKPKVAP